MNYNVGITIYTCILYSYFNSNLQPNDVSFILYDTIGNIEVEFDKHQGVYSFEGYKEDAYSKSLSV